MRNHKVAVAVTALVLAAVLGLTGWALTETWAAGPARTGLDCDRFTFPFCEGPGRQFDASFEAAAPGATGRAVGGFGGAPDCTPRRTPVVFVHGNADNAVNWDSGITGAVGQWSAAPRSVYDEFRAAGYSKCELFGVTYLSEREQRSPLRNYHEPARYIALLDFMAAVRDYTGSDRVDIVGHSLGATMSMAALTWQGETRAGPGWGQVRRFVNIGGGLRGIGSCRSVGYANPAVPTCGSQNVFDRYTFGLHPDRIGYGNNDWTGAAGPHSLRLMPRNHPRVAFYTITAGAYDQVLCGAVSPASTCAKSALFAPAANVRAQLGVGTGTPASAIDYDLADGTIFTLGAGDGDGVGHFKARNNSGAILVHMLTTQCRATACAATYRSGPVTDDGG